MSGDGHAYVKTPEAVMRHSIKTIAIIAAISCSPAMPVLAQNNVAPAPFGPTVPPLSPPPPPVVNPISPNSQPRLDTFSDKVTRCLHYGGTQGLTGGDLSAYSRACANN